MISLGHFCFCDPFSKSEEKNLDVMKISFICLSAQLTFAALLLQAQLRGNTGDREGGRDRGASDPNQSAKSQQDGTGGGGEE